MGKKKSRASQTSQGQRPNVNSWSKKAMKRSMSPLEHMRNQQDAWLQGKNVMLTVPNPNTNETKKPFIRKPAIEVWGRPRRGFTFASGEK